MNKRIIANRFGLIALMSVSLFASTNAFAGSPANAQPVVVTNTTAQPVPMVGLVKDSDAPARKPFQTGILVINAPATKTTFQPLGTVPAGQRLVLERATGYCYSLSYAGLSSSLSGTTKGFEFIPGADVPGITFGASAKFYANPGEDFGITLTNFTANAGGCYISVSGYYVNLP